MEQLLACSMCSPWTRGLAIGVPLQRDASGMKRLASLAWIASAGAHPDS
jgi:hypothetical protein